MPAALVAVAKVSPYKLLYFFQIDPVIAGFYFFKRLDFSSSVAVAAEVAIDGRDCSMKVSAMGVVAEVEVVQEPL